MCMLSPPSPQPLHSHPTEADPQHKNPLNQNPLNKQSQGRHTIIAIVLKIKTKRRKWYDKWKLLANFLSVNIVKFQMSNVMKNNF